MHANHDTQPSLMTARHPLELLLIEAELLLPEAAVRVYCQAGGGGGGDSGELGTGGSVARPARTITAQPACTSESRLERPAAAAGGVAVARFRRQIRHRTSVLVERVTVPRNPYPPNQNYARKTPFAVYRGSLDTGTARLSALWNAAPPTANMLIREAKVKLREWSPYCPCCYESGIVAACVPVYWYSSTAHAGILVQYSSLWNAYWYFAL